MGTSPERAPALPHVFWWLWTGALVNALGTFVFPFLALFLTARGFSTQAAGWTVALFGAGTMISGPIAGWLADHLGRRPTMLASLLAGAAATLPLAVASSPWTLAIDVLILGAVANAFRPVLSTIIVDVVPVHGRERAFGLVYWAHNLGMALSLVAGGMLAVYGYGRLFVADAVTTIVFAALVWANVPETRVPAGAASTEPSGGRGYGAVGRDRDFMAFLGVNLVFLTVFCQFQVAAPIDMAQHGLGPNGFGRVLAVNGFLIALLQPFSTRFTGRWDAAPVLAAAALLVGAGYGAYALCATAADYAIATAIWSLGEILALPAASRLVAELSPADQRGRYQGAFSLSFGLAMFAAPALGGTVMQYLGARTLWSGCLAVGVAVAGAQLVIAGPRRRRLAAMERSTQEVPA